jgi:uncharacterized protein YyaL (SSP411 family)
MNRPLPNKLVHEKSPYLLQHAYNPVQWYPWGPEAFAKARNENKPIFLSIGYSTCHWCHVMEHESFEDEETAQLLNEHFVPMKVDREERPDLDSIYMGFVTATTGSGGWPMSVFLTPEQKPFYGGTYFPPEPRWGSPGFKDLLLSVHNSWVKQEQKVRASGDSFVEAFAQQLKQKKPSPQIFSTETLAKAYSQLEQNFDAQNGGFGSPNGHSPKFPMGHNLSFLLRHWKNADQPLALAIVEKTLSIMAQSGICDQLGGGFHRYSTDTHWQVPHFEKMLYDQALLVKVYLEAFVATGNECYAKTAAETLDYVLRDMRDVEGGFYSAEDADSLPADISGSDHPAGEKKEGAYYVWATSELQELLSPEQFKILSYHYSLEPQGNALFDPHGEFAGKNILHVKRSVQQLAEQFAKPAAEIEKILIESKRILLISRAERPRPHLDDKILVDWNGLMISAFAMAGRILNEQRYLQAAETAINFILQHMQTADGRLYHRYRDGQAGIAAGLEDYAFFAAALLDAYENTFNPRYLKEALRLADTMIELFWDEESGGFYLTAKDGEELIYRPKDVYDGAIPSGNSVAAHTLLRLYHLTFDEKYLKKAEGVFRFFFDDVSAHPGGYCQMMMAAQFSLGPVREITVQADVTVAPGKELLEYILKTWDPQRVLTVQSSNAALEPMVHVCMNRVCHLPVKNIDELKKVLS